MNSHFLRAALIAASALFTMPAAASTEKLLYSFPSNSYPIGRPDQDSNGALYGTADGLDGSGAVFRLKEKDGTWRYQTLFDFSGTSGAYPYAGPIIDRVTGILYGTTTGGGNSGNGTVYSLAPARGGWSEAVLHSFSFSHGSYPYPPLLKDKASGDLYGTTLNGGAYHCGTAFQLAQVNGNWTFSIIYNFQKGGDACHPTVQLKPGAQAGTLIGASSGRKGTLFELKRSNGLWSESVIHTFTGSDGVHPYDIDASHDGTIYGVAYAGGRFGNGVVFQLTPTLNGYTYSVIYDFLGGSDGAFGVGINYDATTGYLYGTTFSGGSSGNGTIFRLAPSGTGWTETVLHSFAGAPNDGGRPYSRPIVDRPTGALYGTTGGGGANDGGTVYMVQP